MPHSTMHLWIAKKISQNLRQKSSASFMLGNIAPDSLNIKADATNEDKQLSHLRQPDFNSGYKNAKKIVSDDDCSEFLKGCATHIMIDHLWLEGPYLDMRKKLKDEITKVEINKQYQKDCEYIELWLFRQSSSRQLWNAAMNAPLERYYDILTPGEIDGYRKSRFKKLNEAKISSTSKYITLDLAYKFMDEAAKKITEEIKG